MMMSPRLLLLVLLVRIQGLHAWTVPPCLRQAMVGAVAAVSLGTTTLPAIAAESRVVGQIAGSGLVFKDTLTIESFEDPKVRGVTLYISNFQRPITERLTSNFFSDPSYASVACAKTSSSIQIADNIAKGLQGEEVFEESKSLLFKTLRVQRIYDEDKKTMVYVSFNTRLDKNEDSNKSRFKSSICAMALFLDQEHHQEAPPVDFRLLRSFPNRLTGRTMSAELRVYPFCLEEQLVGGDLLECVTNLLEQGQIDNSMDANTWFLVLSAALIFFMQAGFAMLCAGSVRIKNVGNTMMKNLLDACGAAIGFFTVGFAFGFGGQDFTTKTTFIGTTNFFMMNVDDMAYWLFEFAFAATSATIVAGTLAERCQMAAYLCYSFFLTAFVYPVVAHAIWSNNGFLSAFNVDPFLGVGMVDFAGSGVVHLTGGTTAVFATMILGPRKGRFYDARGNPLHVPKPFPGHSIALQMLGTFILWFGWYGFNPGSALTLTHTLNTGDIAALAAVNTTLSAAAGGVTALFTNLFIVERRTGEAKFDLVCLMNGCLGGLVAITAGCSTLEPYGAVVVGVIAGWIYLATSHLLIKFRLDDAVDAIPVHMACGAWGVTAVGFLASPPRILAAYDSDAHVGWFYSLGRGSTDASLLAAQICGILFITGWVFVLMFPFFILLNYMGWFRADSLEELVGLDISYHGGSVLGNDEVKLEYVEAFNRRRDSRRNNRRQHSTPDLSNSSYLDNMSSQEQAAMEALHEAPEEVESAGDGRALWQRH